MFRSLFPGHCVWVTVFGLLYFGRLLSGFSNHRELHGAYFWERASCFASLAVMNLQPNCSEQIPVEL